MKLYYAFMNGGEEPTNILFTFRKFQEDRETITYDDCTVQKELTGLTPHKTAITYNPPIKVRRILFDKKDTLYVPRNGSLDMFKIG